MFFLVNRYIGHVADDRLVGPAYSDRSEQIYNRLCFALRDARAEARKLARAIKER